MRLGSSDTHLLLDLEQVICPDSKTESLGFKDLVLTRSGNQLRTSKACSHEYSHHPRGSETRDRSALETKTFITWMVQTLGQGHPMNEQSALIHTQAYFLQVLGCSPAMTMPHSSISGDLPSPPTLIDIQLIDHVALTSAIQQNDSVIHISVLFYILLHYGLSRGIEYSALCYSVGSCLSVLYIIVCIC